MGDEMEAELNLEDLLGEITPSLVTPHLADIVKANSKARPKLIAEYIIRGMVQSLKNPVKKDIIHNGDIHTIHYVNVDPLCTGSWAMMSLMLLQLSYGEQSTLIETLYPANLQLCAKSFAVIFTPELRSETIILKQDAKLLQGVESANAGIAMVLALLKHVGTIPHADEINKNKDMMSRLVSTANDRDKYRNGMEKAQDAAKHQDGLRR